VEQLHLLIDAALAAPDHGRLHPSRFVAVHEGDREALARVFVAGASELEPNAPEEALQRDAEKARHASCLLAIIARVIASHDIVPPSEQWISVGAAMQNMLLAAEALGFGAMIVSGHKVRTKALREAFGLASDEHLVGFIAIGTPESAPKPIDRPAGRDHMVDWVPPAP